MERILIVEDDVELAELIELYLKDAGLAVALAHSGPSGVSLAIQWLPDLILLDVMLPGTTGWEVARAIRQHSRAPILMVTALGDEEDRLRGFDEGADDYIVKPFLPRELVARVKVHLRRASEPAVTSRQESVQFPGFHLDRKSLTLRLEGNPVELTPKQFELLWVLASNPGRTLTRDMLLERVWGFDAGDTRTLEVHMSRLREKLGSRKGWVKTVWGVGYKFEVVKQ